MARQKGIIKLKGTIGDITFLRTQDGYLAKERTSLDGNRIKNDAAFQRTRENGEEFGRAGKATRILSTSLRALLLQVSDSRMTGRMTQRMMKVIQADTVNERGLRNVVDGDATLLIGFEFNNAGKLGGSLYAPFEGTIDRTTGTLTVDLASFIPLNMLAAPKGTTHFKLVSAGVAVDFESEAYESSTSETSVLPWDTTPTAVINQVNSVTANSNRHLFLVVGVSFLQEVNGSMYPLKNGKYNPLAIVAVDAL